MLSPDQFFHGTTHAIKDGVVRPAAFADKNVSEYSMGDPGDMSEGDHAFAIRNDEQYAWHAALNFHPSLRRARVYEVEPAADMKPGPWNKEHPDFLAHHELDDPKDFPHVGPDSDDYPVSLQMKQDAEDARANQHQDEWASPTGFKVKNRIDTMPGRQGTFPGISWGRFSQRPYDQEMNHPLDAQVQYGHGLRGELAGMNSAHEKALKDNEAFNAANPRFRDPAPPKRTGRSLRAFMEGKPEPAPEHRYATLF